MSMLIIRGGRVFDGERLRPEPALDVFVRGDRIESVAPGDRGQSPSVDAAVIDVRGLTVLPGLIDAHFHAVSASLDVASIDRMHPSHRALGAREHLEAALRRGFTTVRDAGGADVGLVRATAEGLIDGPRLFVAGRALSQTGGHGDMRPAEAVSPCGCGYSGALSAVVDGPDQVRAAVREQLRQGVHQIKVFVSGGVLSPTDPIWMDQFTDAEIRAAVEEAATRRRYVMAHAHTANAARRCARNGVRSIEHEHCRAAGVRLGFGTDLFGPLRDRQCEGFRIRGRLQPGLEVLRSATSVNAELLGLAGEIGTVAVGAAADLIAVRGDPVADPAVLAGMATNLMLVVRGGRVVLDRTGGKGK